jgi:hypothetical protein
MIGSMSRHAARTVCSAVRYRSRTRYRDPARRRDQQALVGACDVHHRPLRPVVSSSSGSPHGPKL